MTIVLDMPILMRLLPDQIFRELGLLPSAVGHTEHIKSPSLNLSV
jgi:hypothetical protein